jgi:alginate O-acetyltransferase complex protein AlgI
MEPTLLTSDRAGLIQAHGSQRLAVVGGWMLLLLVLGLLWLLRDLSAPWLWMWFAAFAIFFGFKLLTLIGLDATARQSLSLVRLAAYLFLWPGLRPGVFGQMVGERRLHSGFLWPNGYLQLMLGVIAIWVVPRWLPTNTPIWLRAWMGMVGFSLFVHFGLFDLLAAMWRTLGVPVEELFSNPWRSVSLTDFWSYRWNRSFSEFCRRLVFWPLARRWGTRWASFAVFVFSGFIHEIMISAPARGGYGGPMMYFIINGLAVQIETLSGWQKLTHRLPVLGRLWTMTMVLAPLPLLFHRPFQTQVVLPFLTAIGATGEPVQS